MKCLIILSRHGDAPKRPSGVGSEDRLKDSEIPVLYRRGGQTLRDFVQSESLLPAQVSITHTPKVRTLATGKAYVARAFQGDNKNLPGTQEELLGYELPEVQKTVDERMYYGDLLFDEEAMKEIGEDPYAIAWQDDWPTATKTERQAITPFVDVIKKTAPVLREAYERAITGERRAQVIVSHAGLLEPTMASIIDPSDRKRPCASTQDIGGLFQPSDYATFYINTDGRNKPDVRLVRNMAFNSTRLTS